MFRTLVFADSSDTGFDAKRGQVTLDRVRVENSASNGVTFSTGSVAATVRDSVSSGNGLVGIRADAGATVTMERTASLNNGTNGIEALNPGSTIRIGASTVTGNGTGLFPNGGEIISYGTNKVDGNTIDGAPTSTIPMK